MEMGRREREREEEKIHFLLSSLIPSSFLSPFSRYLPPPPPPPPPPPSLSFLSIGEDTVQ